MHIDLSGKRAVVSGSTAGIGFAIAKGLADSGAQVVINGQTDESVQSAIAEIVKAVPKAVLVGVTADMATAEGAAKLAAAAGHIDILVNSIGLSPQKAFTDLTDDDWLNLFQINVMSGVRLTQKLLPAMVQQGWGRVVFISSESALDIPPDMIPYGMTKLAELGISRGIAESVPGTGVTVNAVLGGPTTSQAVLKMIEPQARATGKSMEEVEKDWLEKNRPTSLIRRFSSPDEIANMVVYVCSPQASATTGAALRVDGGVVRSIL